MRDLLMMSAQQPGSGAAQSARPAITCGIGSSPSLAAAVRVAAHVHSGCRFQHILGTPSGPPSSSFAAASRTVVPLGALPDAHLPSARDRPHVLSGRPMATPMRSHGVWSRRAARHPPQRPRTRIACSSSTPWPLAVVIAPGSGLDRCAPPWASPWRRHHTRGMTVSSVGAA